MYSHPNLSPENFLKIWKFFENLQKSQIRYLEKGVLELCRAATIKPRQIERSCFLLLDHNGQTRIYRLVSGQPDERLWRKHYFAMKDIRQGSATLKSGTKALSAKKTLVSK